jgi:CubicO group peptidase (beta-lactamase class C family)
MPGLLPSGSPSAWARIRPYPAESVTVIDREVEVDPREAGLTHADIDEIWRSVVRLYETRLHPAIALCVRRRGKVVIDRAIGHVHGNAPTDAPDAVRTQVTPRSLFTAYSASKAITAMVIHLLDERGLVHLDDPVAEYVPEFGRNGKEWITLRHVLTHRAGIPAVPRSEVDLSLLSDSRRIFELLCDAKPTSPPGRRLAYHAITGGFVLAAVVERVTGRDIRSFLRSEVLDPLGFEHLSYGVKPEEIPLVATNAFTGPPALPPYSWVLERSIGVTVRQASELANDRAFLTSIVPSGNIVSTANEMSRYFELLLREGELDGHRVFHPRTVRRATAEQTFLEFDAVLVMPVRYGMGFMLGSKWLSLYGHNTPSAFGHLGFTSTLAYADRARDISVSLMTSGKPFLTPEQIFWLQVPRTIARRTAK